MFPLRFFIEYSGCKVYNAVAAKHHDTADTAITSISICFAIDVYQ